MLDKDPAELEHGLREQTYHQTPLTFSNGKSSRALQRDSETAQVTEDDLGLHTNGRHRFTVNFPSF
jgi:hypothetical protein